MAVITASIGNPAQFLQKAREWKLVTWGPMANGDVGSAFDLVNHADRSVHVVGTFGAGGSVSLKGSNDGVDWRTLRDPLGNALTFTSADLKGVLELPRYVRPEVTAGDGTTAITVNLLVKE